MSDIKINAQRALALLQEAVAERGDQFVYAQESKVVRGAHENLEERGCWYELNGAPSCGVGIALHKAGVTLRLLDTLDQAPGDTSITAVDHILSENGVELTLGALTVFSQFQTNQDLQATWGEALQDATKAAQSTKEQS